MGRIIIADKLFLKYFPSVNLQAAILLHCCLAVINAWTEISA